jgi:hypothetical protein
LAASAGLLAGCRATSQPIPTPVSASTDIPVPTNTLVPTNTRQPTATPTSAPTATPTPTLVADARRPDIIKRYPDVPSKVVHAHHPGAWNGEELVSEAIRQMLDASITELTGLNDAHEAWAALFDPTERVAIKVNAFQNSLIWTHVPLVMTVTERLQKVGVPAEQIVIFDYRTSELRGAGFPINKDGPGVRCYGTDEGYTGGWEVVGRKTELSDILMDCTALINMPVLKSHKYAGISFAMKNHYGTIPNPWDFHHGAQIKHGLAELNTLPPIKDRTRLVIGDVLTACLRYRNSYPYWSADWTGDSILMSFDSVAHDAIGFQILSQLLAKDGGNPTAMTEMAGPWLESGAELGLGTNDPDNIELVEVSAG